MWFKKITHGKGGNRRTELEGEHSLPIANCIPYFWWIELRTECRFLFFLLASEPPIATFFFLFCSETVFSSWSWNISDTFSEICLKQNVWKKNHKHVQKQRIQGIKKTQFLMYNFPLFPHFPPFLSPRHLESKLRIPAVGQREVERNGSWFILIPQHKSNPTAGWGELIIRAECDVHWQHLFSPPLLSHFPSLIPLWPTELLQCKPV